MCQQERISDGSILYKWPQASNGTTINITCPNNPAFSVSRECSVGGQWQDFDREGCGVLAERLKMISRASMNVWLILKFLHPTQSHILISLQLTNEMLEEIVSTLSEIVTEGNEADQTAENINETSIVFSNIVDYISSSNANITTNVRL